VPPDRPVGIRWTIGDVSPRGFSALQLSIAGAHRLFGARARYAVVVNTIAVEEAKRRTGGLPQQVEWRPAGDLPAFLGAVTDASMAEGVAWKLAPLRLFPERWEISLDNDCILWAVPEAMRRWFDDDPSRCLIAADVRLALGAFTALTRPEPRNTGIRGFPPGYDLGAALARVLAGHPTRLSSELAEQGLQVVALDLDRPARVIGTDEVTICSPFWPHQNRLGRCGAHFVGLNTRNLPFDYYGRPATELVAEHWDRYLPELRRRVGLSLAA